MTAGGVNIGIGTGFVNSTQLQTTFGSAMTNMSFTVAGDFEINSNVTFNTCQFTANSGKRILVSPGATLNANTCIFGTCGNFMWKGIEVNPWAAGSGAIATIRLQGCTISNALYGVNYLGGANNPNDIFINNSFNANFIGIYVAVGAEFWVNSFYGNSFNGAALKPAYSGMSVNFSSNLLPPNSSYFAWSWAGILYINNFGGGNSYIGSSTTAMPKNTFQNMYNGILVNGGNYTIRNSEFLNMIFDPSINSGSFLARPTGNGIYAYNPYYWEMGSSTIYEISGFGKNGNVNFNNCRVGANLNGYSLLKMQNNRMTNVAQGLRYISGTSRARNEMNVWDNNITASQYGVYAVNSAREFSNGQILRNDILLNGSNYAHAGISWEHTVNGTNTKLLQNNNVTLNAGTAGFAIDINGINQLQSSGNVIQVNNPTTKLGGIRYSICNMINENLNKVTGTNAATQNSSNSFFPVGIQYNNSNGNFNCNELRTIYTGTRFTANCLNSSIAKNKWFNHNVGLRLDASASLTPQTRKGNSFNGTASSKQTLSSQSSPTIFEVGWSSTPLTKYCPTTSNQSTPAPFKAIVSGTDNDACSSSSGGGGGSGSGSSVSLVTLSGLAGAILNNTLSFSEYSPELVWQQTIELYAMLKPIQATLDSPSNELSFIKKYDTTEIAYFYELENQGNEVPELPPSQEQQILNWYQSLDSHYIYMNDLGILLNETPMDSIDDRDSITNLINITMESINDLNNSINGIYIAQISNDTANYDSLLILNNGLTVSENSEILLQQYNSVFLDKIAQGNLDLSPSQVSTIYSVANHCPLINFEAVYKSRAIVRLFNDSIWWNDEDLCDTAGMAYKVAGSPIENKMICTLYPNPTKDKTTIHFSKIPASDIEILISDINGKVYLRDRLVLNSSILPINTAHYPSGIFMIKLWHEGKELHQIKLEIQK